MSRASELADAITPSKDNVPELGDLLSAAAELRRLERVKAELVEVLQKALSLSASRWLFHNNALYERARAALTSATKEQQ